MAVQFSVAVRNARLDAVESAIGASPTLEFRTGAPPATTATADSGSLLATLALPADFMASASGGSKSLSGTWQANASGTGTVGHFRVKASGGTVHTQGTVTVTGGGGDMTVQNVSFAAGQQITITGYTLTDGNV